VKDNESGLYYANARYYDPATARFTTEDPEAGKDLTPPSLHRYLYAYANPTVWVDPAGRQSEGPGYEAIEYLHPTQEERKEFVRRVGDGQSGGRAGLAEWGYESVASLLSFAGTYAKAHFEALLDDYDGPANRKLSAGLRTTAVFLANDPVGKTVQGFKQREEEVNAFTREGDFYNAARNQNKVTADVGTAVAGLPSLARSGVRQVAKGLRGVEVATVVEGADGSVALKRPAEFGTNSGTFGDSIRPQQKPAGDLVNWVDEGGNLREGGSPGMRPDAYEFQSGTPGSRSNAMSGRGQAPYLEFTNAEGKTVGAKFDGVQGTELIDRKLNPVFSSKAIDQAQRQAAVAQHYGLNAVWEMKTAEAVEAANRFMRANKIEGITVRLGDQR
jgi:RHS repeat-associated protein